MESEKVTRYTFDDAQHAADMLTELIAKRRDPSKPAIRIIVHEWNGFKCLRYMFPNSSGEHELTRYFKTYEDIVDLVSAVMNTIQFFL
jgi:hypothetical protein